MQLSRRRGDQGLAGLVVAGLMVLTGCGAPTTPTPPAGTTTAAPAANPTPADAPATEPYDGPMRLAQDFSDEATPAQRSGAAGRALECDGAVYAGGGGDYVDGGLVTVQSSPRRALSNLLRRDPPRVPATGYQVERDAGRRVLLSYDVAGRSRVTVIAANGVRDHEGDVGWGVESWAQCDPAELPEPVSRSLGFEVWQRASGERVPVTVISSYPGPEHCDWQDITFLQLDGDSGPQYVRDPRGELAPYLRSTFTRVGAPAAGSTDTGYQRAGRRLWLGPDAGDGKPSAAYLVSTANRSDVERWPAAARPIGCA